MTFSKVENIVLIKKILKVELHPQLFLVSKRVGKV